MNQENQTKGDQYGTIECHLLRLVQLRTFTRTQISPLRESDPSLNLTRRLKESDIALRGYVTDLPELLSSREFVRCVMRKLSRTKLS